MNQPNPTAERYKTAWDLSGVNVKDAHKATGISKPMLYHYANQKYIPSVAALQLLHPVTGISPNYVLLGLGDPLTHRPAKKENGATTLSIGRVAEFSEARELLSKTRTLEIRSGVWECKACEIKITVTNDLAVFHRAGNAPTQAFNFTSFFEWKKQHRNE